MDKKYLNKVLDQIVNETIVDYDEGIVDTTYIPSPSNTHFFIRPFPPLSLFSHHCKEVYGLNEDETRYVWDNYQRIIKDKINNEK